MGFLSHSQPVLCASVTGVGPSMMGGANTVAQCLDSGN